MSTAQGYDEQVARLAGVERVEITAGRNSTLVSVIFDDGFIVRNRNNTTAFSIVKMVRDWPSHSASNVRVYIPRFNPC